MHVQVRHSEDAKRKKTAASALEMTPGRAEALANLKRSIIAAHQKKERRSWRAADCRPLEHLRLCPPTILPCLKPRGYKA